MVTFHFMTWNTSLYVQGNRLGRKTEKIDREKTAFGTEQRQIDHVLLENSKRIADQYSCKNAYVDREMDASDHYPLYWTIECKNEN